MAATNEQGAFGVPDGARYLGLGPTLLKELLASGEIRSFRAGRRRLVSRSALDGWIAERESAEREAGGAR